MMGAAFLILAHLSEQNNHPEIARMTAERALGGQRNLRCATGCMLAADSTNRWPRSL